MPYKDIENRRKSWRRWKEKHSHEHKKRQAIQKQAVYSNPIQKHCSIKGCEILGERHHPNYDRPEEIIWLCKKHHEQIHHNEERKCNFPGCELKHHAHGFCNRHMKKWKRGTL
jgi:hypothetical protein